MREEKPSSPQGEIVGLEAPSSPRRVLKQTSVHNVSLHPHVKFKSCLLKFDAVCTVSLQPCRRLQHVVFFLCYERLLSTRISNFARVSLERAPVGVRRFRPSVAVGSVCCFRPNFGRVELVIFSIFFKRLSSGFMFGDNTHPLAHPVLFLCGFPRGGVVGFKDVRIS